jgi:hypothetical protein
VDAPHALGLWPSTTATPGSFLRDPDQHHTAVTPVALGSLDQRAGDLLLVLPLGHGDRHAAALRHLYNRMLGQLYHCLQTSQTYDPIKAYGPPPRLPNKLPLDS